jgi:hypothetical protein
MDLPGHAVAADTITKLPPEARGRTVLSGSHGGVYPGWLAAAAGARAVVLSDAGIGKDAAGVAGLALCAQLGMAAAAVDASTARIGDSADMLARGRISWTNAPARAAGVAPSQACRDALAALADAPTWDAALPPRPGEGRTTLDLAQARRPVVLVDSAALVDPADAGAVIVTGSHGALVGGRPELALRVDGFAALFNDAGGGPDDWGSSRLPALDRRGIAGATVAAASARIGAARSTYEDGRLSAVNATAAALGLAVGQSARDAVARLAAVDGRSA